MIVPCVTYRGNGGESLTGLKDTGGRWVNTVGSGVGWCTVPCCLHIQWDSWPYVRLGVHGSCHMSHLSSLNYHANRRKVA